jgi:uncharacterized membrane protein
MGKKTNLYVISASSVHVQVRELHPANSDILKAASTPIILFISLSYLYYLIYFIISSFKVLPSYQSYIYVPTLPMVSARKNEV